VQGAQRAARRARHDPAFILPEGKDIAVAVPHEQVAHLAQAAGVSIITVERREAGTSEARAPSCHP
jgi:hypothetical protein